MVFKSTTMVQRGLPLLRSQKQKSCSHYCLSVARGPCRQKNRMMTGGNMGRWKPPGGPKYKFIFIYYFFCFLIERVILGLKHSCWLLTSIFWHQIKLHRVTANSLFFFESKLVIHQAPQLCDLRTDFSLPSGKGRHIPAVEGDKTWRLASWVWQKTLFMSTVSGAILDGCLTSAWWLPVKKVNPERALSQVSMRSQPKNILELLGIKIDHRRSHFQRRVSPI